MGALPLDFENNIMKPFLICKQDQTFNLFSDVILLRLKRGLCTREFIGSLVYSSYEC